MNTYFRIPKELIYEPKYKELSSNAKLMYAILRDRLDLSIASNLYDDSFNYYVICEIDEIELLLDCSRHTAIKVLKDLETFGLIKKGKLGKGNSNILYIGTV